MTQALGNLLIFFAILLFLYIIWIAVLLVSRSRKVATEQIDPDSFLLVYASQSGQVQDFAQQTAQQLQAHQEKVHCINIQDLTLEQLKQARRVLWMVSTYGEGDAPDTAQHFSKQYLNQKLDLSQQQFAVLAFGDRGYTDFCAFGQRLFQWLNTNQAKPMFDLVTVDHMSADDLAHWSSQLSHVTQYQLELGQAERKWQSLTLRERHLLNAGSQGTGLYHIIFDVSPELQWQSGDILEVQCQNSAAELQQFLQQHPDIPVELQQALKIKNLRIIPEKAEQQPVADWITSFANLPIREYSIASIASQKQLALVVRQEVHEQELGLGSGMLTQHLSIGSTIQACIRQHQSFHLPQKDVPIIFIGNGSGIAGLIGHLYQRQAWGYSRNWLIYGERQQQYDAIFADELAQLQQAGILPQLNLVYSRDQQAEKYVQDVLYAQANRLQTWLEQGAYIYVCGGLKGMGNSVDAALHDILGDAKVQELRQSGHYRRDVY